MKSDDFGLVNCAECGAELLGERTAQMVRDAHGGRIPSGFGQAVRGRMKGRPYCDACLSHRRPPSRAATADDSAGPWAENAVRHLEEG